MLTLKHAERLSEGGTLLREAIGDPKINFRGSKKFIHVCED
jgi:hypothetical protein